MDNKETEKIWVKHNREEVDPVMLEISKFTLDGTPTCMAWYGSGSHPRMACQFIGSSHMGCKYHCMITGKEIFPLNGNGILIPVDSCPIWENRI